MKAKRLALTGASGFVGGELMRGLRGCGFDVVPLTRAAIAGEPQWIRYSLGDAPDLRGFDALIHCAYDFRNPAANVGGSIRLFDAARQAGVAQMVFVSSMSSFEGCKSEYGQGKLQVEKHVSGLGGTSFRLGFVYDDTERGLSGTLRKLVRTLPVIPLPGLGRQPLYRVAAKDMAPAFAAALDRPPGASVLPLAAMESTTLAGILRLNARDMGKHVVLLPIPWQVMWLGLRSLEALGANIPFRSDSLISLVNQPTSRDRT